MKSNEKVSKTVSVIIHNESNSYESKMSFVSSTATSLRKYLVIASFAGMGLLATGCATGYVKTEPTYVEYSRPVKPSHQHIWVGDNYTYNRRTGVYVQKNGYWQKPVRNRTYNQGYWQSGPRGHYWAKGKWHRNR